MTIEAVTLSISYSVKEANPISLTTIPNSQHENGWFLGSKGQNFYIKCDSQRGLFSNESRSLIFIE